MTLGEKHDLHRTGEKKLQPGKQCSDMLHEINEDYDSLFRATGARTKKRQEIFKSVHFPGLRLERCFQ